MPLILPPFGIAQAPSGFSMRSLRFDGTSAYLTRTLGAPTNDKVYTFSFWVKRWSNDFGMIIASGTAYDSAFFALRWNNDGLSVTRGNLEFKRTSRLFRDFGAWSHIVVAVDTTNGTAADRIKVYVNGVRETDFSTDVNPSLNELWDINTSGKVLVIGRESVAPGDYISNYLADVIVVDGQALTPSTFAETDPITNQWVPKNNPVNGVTMGNNGFWLSFDNASSTTTLGYDDAGGARGAGAGSDDWTLNNFSVSAGSTYDSMFDTPVNYDDGANGRGNYCTLSLLAQHASAVLSDGALVVAAGSAAWQGAVGTHMLTAGKWFFEGLVFSHGTGYSLGLANDSWDLSNVVGGTNTWGVYWDGTDTYTSANGSATSRSVTPANGYVYCVAVDIDAGKMWFGYTSTGTITWFGGGDPEAGTTPTYTFTAGTPLFPAASTYNTTARLSLNFGQRTFSATRPASFKAVCTQNLPAPAIVLPTSHFDVRTYTGSSGTRTISDVAFQPDMVWFKNRGNAQNHKMFQVHSGDGYGLTPNLNDDSVLDSICTIAANGFSLATGNRAYSDSNADAYVSWMWRAGGAPSANSDGSISSQVSVNATAGISIVKFTGTGSNGTVGHGLGKVPKMIIVKSITTTGADQGWVVYHNGVAADPETDYLLLNSTAAASDLNTAWNDTAPTSSVFSVGTATGTNGSGEVFIAICFADVEAFSKMGKFTGNANANGPFVWCGFEPEFVLIKSAAASASWVILDRERPTYNVRTGKLYPDLTAVEGVAATIDFLSNGFKLRTASTDANPSGLAVFAAFAKTPFKFARAR